MKLSHDTIEQYTKFMQDFIPYIKSLEFPDGVKVINSGRKTGFVGFILSLQNAISMFHDLLAKTDLYFFPTYKISQDHIETTFSAIRSRLRYNNNPTCREFKAAYKRIIIHNEVVGSVFVNYSMLEYTKHLSVDTSKCEKNLMFNLNSHWLPERHLDDHDYFETYINMTKYNMEDTCHYIAGFVVKKLLKKVDCQSCQNSLIKPGYDNENSLTSLKNRGELIIPSKSVKTICEEVKRIFRAHEPIYFSNTRNKLYLLNKLKSSLYKTNNTCLFNCQSQTSALDTHQNKLINLIAVTYVDIRVFHELRKINDVNIKSGKTRSKLTKLVHFRHE